MVEAVTPGLLQNDFKNRPKYSVSSFSPWRGQSKTNLEPTPYRAVQQFGMVGCRDDHRVAR